MDYLIARRSVYDLLRRIFIEEPSVDLILFLKKTNIDEIIIPEMFDCANVIHYMHSAIDSLTNLTISDDSHDFQDIHWDYTRLFIGPNTLPSSPWESSYKNDKLLFTEITSQVEKFYNKHGFYLSNNEREAADHIGLEIDFIYHLNEKNYSLDAISSIDLRENLNAQIYFLDNHVLTFSTLLMTSVTSHAQTEFYKNISLFTGEFIKYDAEKIKSLLLEI